jgi:ribosomal protein S19E (S16A)
MVVNAMSNKQEKELNETFPQQEGWNYYRCAG